MGGLDIDCFFVTVVNGHEFPQLSSLRLQSFLFFECVFEGGSESISLD